MLGGAAETRLPTQLALGVEVSRMLFTLERAMDIRYTLKREQPTALGLR